MDALKARKWILLFTGAGLFAWVLWRAIHLSFTHDESLSYFILKGNAFTRDTANHHLLNTWLMGAMNRLFGSSEFVLRLPNVLAFLLYFWAARKMLLQSRGWGQFATGTVLLFMVPFLLDFFSLARGYGLSMGLMMASVLYLLKATQAGSRPNDFLKPAALSLLFGLLSVYAILGMFTFFLALAGTLSLVLLLKVKPADTKVYVYFLMLLLLAAVLLVPAVKRLLFLNEMGQLYYGDFTLMEMVNSLRRVLMYRAGYPAWVNAGLVYALVAVLPLGIAGMLLPRDRKGQLTAVVMLLALVTAGAVVLNAWKGARFPSERTALFYLPLLGLMVFLLAGHWGERLRVGTATGVVAAGLLCAPLVVHFALRMNVRQVHTWAYDAHNSDVATWLREFAAGRTGTVIVECDEMTLPGIRFYVETQELNVQVQEARPDMLRAEVVYRMKREEFVPPYERVAFFPDAGTELLVKRGRE